MTTTTKTLTMKTEAAFILSNGAGWTWITWTHEAATKHAAIIAKAEELGAVRWDFSQARHDFADRF